MSEIRRGYTIFECSCCCYMWKEETGDSEGEYASDGCHVCGGYSYPVTYITHSEWQKKKTKTIID